MCIEPMIDICKLLAYNNYMEYKELLRSTGLRITPARLAVFSILEDSTKPLDINSIYQEVAKRHVDADQVTIYRIIENFIDKNLVTRIRLAEKKFYYESKRAEHHHAICEKCGSIADVSNCSIGKVEREIEKTKGFLVNSHSLEFFGLCNKCR